MEYSDSEDPLNDILGPEDFCSGESNAEDDDNENEDQEKKSEGKEEKAEAEPKKVRKRRQVNPSKRAKLNPATLRGPNGLEALKKAFENFQFKGNHHEKEDLTKLMKILQHWMCNRLFPVGTFASNMEQLEALGSKKEVQTYMKKIRMGIDEWGMVNTGDSGNKPAAAKVSDDEDDQQNMGQNNFDSWWEQQIANTHSDDDAEDLAMLETIQKADATPSLNETAASTQPSSIQINVTLTPDQLERIARNKRMAEERRLKRLSTQSSVKEEGTLD